MPKARAWCAAAEPWCCAPRRWRRASLVVVKAPFRRLVAAVSVGIVAGEARLDLNYAEDKGAEVDANVVVADPDAFVEVQVTGEEGTFDRAELDRLLDLASAGTRALFAAQKA